MANSVVEADVIDDDVDPDEPASPFNVREAFLSRLEKDPDFVERLIGDPSAIVTAAGLTGPDVEAVVANLRARSGGGGEVARSRRLAAAAFALLAATRFPVAGRNERGRRE